MNKIATVPPAKSGESAAKPIADLREWLSRVEAIGELTKVAQPVDRDEEMSAISYLVAKQQPSPVGAVRAPARLRQRARSAPRCCGMSSARASSAWRSRSRSRPTRRPSN